MSEVVYHRKKDGILRLEPYEGPGMIGFHCRYLTWWERIWFALGGRP